MGKNIGQLLCLCQQQHYCNSPYLFYYSTSSKCFKLKYVLDSLLCHKNEKRLYWNASSILFCTFSTSNQVHSKHPEYTWRVILFEFHPGCSRKPPRSPSNKNVKNCGGMPLDPASHPFVSFSPSCLSQSLPSLSLTMHVRYTSKSHLTLFQPWYSTRPF
jgi:hypothetical protein